MIFCMWACLRLCVTHLSLVQSLYGGIGPVSTAWFNDVIRADAQHRAGVSTWAVSNDDHPRPFCPGHLPQVLLTKLQKKTFSLAVRFFHWIKNIQNNQFSFPEQMTLMNQFCYVNQKHTAQPVCSNSLTNDYIPVVFVNQKHAKRPTGPQFDLITLMNQLNHQTNSVPTV